MIVRTLIVGARQIQKIYNQPLNIGKNLTKKAYNKINLIIIKGVNGSKIILKKMKKIQRIIRALLKT